MISGDTENIRTWNVCYYPGCCSHSPHSLIKTNSPHQRSIGVNCFNDAFVSRPDTSQATRGTASTDGCRPTAWVGALCSYTLHILLLFYGYYYRLATDYCIHLLNNVSPLVKHHLLHLFHDLCLRVAVDAALQWILSCWECCLLRCHSVCELHSAVVTRWVFVLREMPACHLSVSRWLLRLLVQVRRR